MILLWMLDCFLFIDFLFVFCMLCVDILFLGWRISTSFVRASILYLFVVNEMFVWSNVLLRCYVVWCWCICDIVWYSYGFVVLLCLLWMLFVLLVIWCWCWVMIFWFMKCVDFVCFVLFWVFGVCLIVYDGYCVVCVSLICWVLFVVEVLGEGGFAEWDA